MQNGRKIIGESNNTPVACITKNAAELNEDINSVVFSGWFYDDGICMFRSLVSALILSIQQETEKQAIEITQKPIISLI